MSKRMKSIGILALLTALMAPSGMAFADSTPISSIPKGITVTTTTPVKSFVAVALPQHKGGLVWRIARSFNANVASEANEANVGANVVIVFKTKAVGNAVVVFALTKGDTGSKAYASYTETIHVR